MSFRKYRTEEPLHHREHRLWGKLKLSISVPLLYWDAKKQAGMLLALFQSKRERIFVNALRSTLQFPQNPWYTYSSYHTLYKMNNVFKLNFSRSKHAWKRVKLIFLLLMAKHTHWSSDEETLLVKLLNSKPKASPSDLARDFKLKDKKLRSDNSIKSKINQLQKKVAPQSTKR